MAIGNPLGYDDTATTGIVSALNRPVTVTDDDNNAIVTNAVQIDAAINPGNSGGPTFNAAGQVIGINSSIASTASSSGTAGSIGIGFAIPSNLVKRVTNEIIDNGSVKHVVLGITIKSSSVEADGVTRGCAQVQAVTDGGPASKAGVKAGDSIVAFNGKAVSLIYGQMVVVNDDDQLSGRRRWRASPNAAPEELAAIGTLAADQYAGALGLPLLVATSMATTESTSSVTASNRPPY